MNDEMRLFLGFEALAPWPSQFPNGRMIETKSRHITTAFFGNTSLFRLTSLLDDMPKPPWNVGTVGIFDKVLFLPHNHPRVVALNAPPLTHSDPFFSYQMHLTTWFEEKNYQLDKRDFLPHVTLARSPFNATEWKNLFSPLPYFTSSLHLYKSLGNLQYEIIWSHQIKPPFTEIEHVADIAFQISGQTPEEIHQNAQIALSFHCPEILPYLKRENLSKSLPQIMMDLNDLVSLADQEIGTPFKAVSYHGDLLQNKNGTLTWMMIIDV